LCAQELRIRDASNIVRLCQPCTASMMSDARRAKRHTTEKEGVVPVLGHASCIVSRGACCVGKLSVMLSILGVRSTASKCCVDHRSAEWAVSEGNASWCAHTHELLLPCLAVDSQLHVLCHPVCFKAGDTQADGGGGGAGGVQSAKLQLDSGVVLWCCRETRAREGGERG
jgi:hypothetical protein